MSGWGSIYSNAVSAMRQHSATLARLQEQSASGKRVITASDDPASASRILQLRCQSRSSSTYIDNLDSVSLSLEQISSSLESTSTALVRVGELLTQGATGTLGAENREAVANEIDGLLEQVLSEANQKSMGRFLFGGHNISTPPYSAERTDGKITKVIYQGAGEDLPVPVGPGITYSGVMVGDDAYASHSRQDPVFLGSTGIQAGTGTSSVRGDVYLTVSHGETLYSADAHGLARGTDSDDDTLFGEHTLQIDSTDNTLRLDGGAAVTFQPGDTNIQLTSADGDVLHVDVSAWDGTDATVQIIGQAELSIDDGLTTMVVSDFSQDVAVMDADGRVLYVDPSGIDTEGTEFVRNAGTYDLFNTLISIRDLMSNERDFSDQRQMELLQQAEGALDEVSGVVRSSATIAGARLQAMDSLRNSLDDIQFAIDSEADALEETDIVEVAMELAETQTYYEMTLTVASKLLTMSLLDFI
jgi:flagellar hook-associated protein 3 FlgL